MGLIQSFCILKIDFPPKFVVGQPYRFVTKFANIIDIKVHEMMEVTKKSKLGTKTKLVCVMLDQICSSFRFYILILFGYLSLSIYLVLINNICFIIMDSGEHLV